jgi:hypothetical protein
MPGQRDPNRGMVVAREACVVFVGARAPVYHVASVRDRRTDQMVDVPLTEYPPKDPGAEGRSYVFKQFQRVSKSHEAVKESPSSFMPVDELDDAELELVTS